jgi:GT2 family glycosyltransferase
MTLGVTVVVCTRDRPELVRATVRSILDGSEIPQELIVVDQSIGPRQDLEPLAAETGCAVRHLRLPETGLSRARNTGIHAASCDVVAFVDDDVVAAAEWLSSLVHPLEHTERLATTGRVLIGEAEVRNALEPSSAVSPHPAEFAGRLPRDVLAGGNMAVPRKAFAEVGVFDERLGAGAAYPAADDNDFGYRLLEAGYRIAYVPEATVYHRAWRPGADYLRLRWRYGVGQGGFYAKHTSLRDTHILRRFAGHAVRRIAFLPVRTFYDRRRLAGDLAFLAGLLTGFGRWLATERRRQPLRSARGE